MTSSNHPTAQEPSTLGLAAQTIDLSGKQALVCGASQGIGAAVARQLAGQGAAVTLLARSADRLAAVASEIAAANARGGSAPKPAVLALDLGDEGPTRTAIGRLIEERGPIQILINNAGGPAPGPILEAPLDAFRKGFAEHVLASQLLASLLVPGMKAAGYGRIVNIVSVSAKQPIPNLGVSNTIRAALSAWAKTLAGEVAPHGITVNNVLPGYTDTPRLRSLLEATAARSGRSVEAVTNEWRSLVPAGRFAEPSEIAAAVGFLASPAASYVTGIHLPVDGGRLSTL
jgi:3-oxoacyl-[acyl-carrier protein] reductase